MIDLHTHTFFSDGILIPSELVYTAKQKGYTAMAITDHIDFSNMDFVIPRIVKVVKMLSQSYDIKVLPGAELTYVPPKLIKDAAAQCRELGAKVIVVHGQTVAESVPPETNFYAVNADIDILAHPGILSREVAEIAAARDIKIEITTRKHHSVANKEVAATALEAKSKLILDTDTHTPENLMSKELIIKTLSQAGLPAEYFEIMQKHSLEIISKYE
ncbi:MAG: histidinol phosphate phosphatase domain-containing protein [Elusimicrobiota bacterium]|jgi:histidinol phosphatase-like PHP family hydrolase|nr:histidinol phosphate phosphatase domain-containing protein [Elusimicrobiota bacterium]